MHFHLLSLLCSSIRTPLLYQFPPFSHLVTSKPKDGSKGTAGDHYSWLSHPHTHPYDINYDFQAGAHTHAHASHSYLPRGLYTACSALPCDVHPTSDILLAVLAHRSASRIPTRLSWRGKSHYMRFLRGR